jgi:hypothetical protein
MTTTNSKLCFYRVKGEALRSIRIKVVDDTEELLRKADAVLAESHSWRRTHSRSIRLSPCWADLAEDLVSKVMMFWSPGYGYMDELKEFQDEKIYGCSPVFASYRYGVPRGLKVTRGHLFGRVDMDGLPMRGLPPLPSLSSLPMLWDDSWLGGRQSEINYELGEIERDGGGWELWGLWGNVGWDTRCSGLPYPKHVRVARALQLGWNKV